MNTPVLLELHKSLGARIGDYAGWRLPIDYGSSIREVQAVRTAAGLFDVSHMGRLDLVGEGAVDVLRHVMTNDVLSLIDCAGQYTLMLNEAGGVKDDLILYRRAADSFFLVVNAANHGKDTGWISSHIHNRSELIDCTSSTAMFALQGPKSAEIAARAGFGGTSELRRFHFIDREFSGRRLLIARTGYTGEDGFEIISHADDAKPVWKMLISAGADLGLVPCGLAARDILRIEAGLPLYGHEIDENITPVEAGLMHFVRKTRDDFLGKAAIVGLEPVERLVGIEMSGRMVPRTGDAVITSSGHGRVTSGTYSPTLGKGIAIAFVPSEAEDGEETEVEIHGTRRTGAIGHLPLYSRRRMAQFVR